MKSVCSQDQIVALPIFREIFARVINHMVCAKRTRRVQFPRAARGCDFRSKRFGNLYRKCAHAARCAVHQNLVALLDVPLVTQRLKGADCRHWYGRCILERQVGRLRHQFIFGHTYIFRKSPANTAENFIAWFESSCVPASLFHLSSEIHSQSCDLWFAQPCADANDEGRAPHEMPVERIDGSRANFYQNLVVLGERLFNLRDSENIWWPD